MIRLRLNKQSVVSVAFVFTTSLGLISPAAAQVESRWMAVGSLNHWFAATGHEIEEGRVAVQQDGLQWPAYYKYQDMSAASGLWLGVQNWTEAGSGPKTWTVKVVHVGPRVNGNNEFFPMKFETVSRFAPPTVFVDGSPSVGKPLNNTRVDPTLKCDRMINNVVNTAIGVTMTRKILAWCQTYHDNYFIYEYTFTNTGQIDGTTNAPLAGQTLTGLRVFIQSRYAPCYDGGDEIADPTRWGKWTMNDARGDGVKPDPVGEQFRCRFTYSGHCPTFTDYDNIGAPMFKPAPPANDPADTTGRLAAAQFIGTVTLHADRSATDTTDDPSQPSTTTYFDSDEKQNPPTSSNSQFDEGLMNSEYAWMSGGHTSPRHVDKVQPDGVFDLPGTWGDPVFGKSGGNSTADGYGPYTLAPGQSIHIVCAEGAAGLSRERCIAIGRQYKQSGGPTYDLKSPAVKAKNDSVFTGRDSLFQTFARALANYNSGYNIPRPPLPPKTLNVVSGGDKVLLTWETYGADPNLRGFSIYRCIGRSDGQYSFVTTVGPGVTSFADTGIIRGYANYYYVISVGPVNADPTGKTPIGVALTSNRVMSQSYDASYLRRQAGTSMSQIRIVPNPYSIASDVTRLRFTQNEADKIAFYNIPGYCTIKIYTEVGELIKEIIHTNGSGDEYWFSNTSSGQVIVSGIYIVVFENSQTGERTIKKLAVIR